MTPAGGAHDPLEWKFVQSFGDDNSSDDDLVTSVEFDATGDFLAVGDKAGRICIFDCHRNPPPPPPSHHLNNLRPSPPLPTFPIEYRFYTEFQSHEPEFDCLKSLEIEERIHCIRWGHRTPTGLFLLAANDKTIKLWKVYEKKIKTRKDVSMKRANFITPSTSHHSALTIPRLTHSQTVTTATPKRIYANAHGYHINSVSINSDGETFISADDLRINLWHLNVSNESFNIVDVKPTNLEELTEVITSATFHPTHHNLLLYSSSRGSMRLIDLRDNALCDSHAKQLEAEEDIAGKSFFSEIISSISDCKFSGDEGRYVVSRDYLTVKLWDLHMEARPLSVIHVHDFLKVHLCDLYENDCIFDKFQVSINTQGTRGVTGSYNNHFVLFDLMGEVGGGGGGGVGGQPKAGGGQVTIEALKDGPRRREVGGVASNGASMKKGKASGKDKEREREREKEREKLNALAMGGNETFSVQSMDFGKKALHVAWHPRANSVAVAGLNKLYIYTATPQDTNAPT